MGTCHIHGLLFLFLLGAASLTCMYGKVTQNVSCYKGIYMGIEADPLRAFNWTAGKVETCDNGRFCQETILMIAAGAEYAILATKGCILAEVPETTLIQHAPAPGLVAFSFSNYCDEPLCNNKDSMSSIWTPEDSPASGVSTSLYCPTCVALGTCFSAPSLPCPNSTTQCYQGKLQLTGGGINTVVEVKGCTAITGCRLMSGFFTVGVLEVKEVCPHQSLAQPRKVENGATRLPFPVWGLELLLLFLLQPLAHCS
ncbi:testis-expressed protein 101 [Elephas maximus indicus]|uniref:testis-expressed protein 101 n=1 Tax=Elephas maximus indicus TaxID=99487 RepID=UPI002116F9C1|nr:testis-expressed protein 101 [Elephas maximus indicus]